MDFSQLLSLLLVKPRLERLKHPKLLPVFSQYLVLVPEREEEERDGAKAEGDSTCYQELLLCRYTIDPAEGTNGRSLLIINHNQETTVFQNSYLLNFYNRFSGSVP